MYFIEDGNEVKNFFAWNLGMIVWAIPANQHLPIIHSDDQPSIFWITNPDNVFLHNVAIGLAIFCLGIPLTFAR